MSTQNAENKRGFTVGEKWIIWGVFCLLIGLSTYRFSVFLGLMLVSFGLNSITKKQWGILPVVAVIAGVLGLAFSKFLF